MGKTVIKTHGCVRVSGQESHVTHKYQDTRSCVSGQESRVRRIKTHGHVSVAKKAV